MRSEPSVRRTQELNGAASGQTVQHSAVPLLAPIAPRTAKPLLAGPASRPCQVCGSGRRVAAPPSLRSATRWEAGQPDLSRRVALPPDDAWLNDQMPPEPPTSAHLHLTGLQASAPAPSSKRTAKQALPKYHLDPQISRSILVRLQTCGVRRALRDLGQLGT